MPSCPGSDPTSGWSLSLAASVVFARVPFFIEWRCNLSRRDDQQLLTRKEAAKFLAIKPQTLAKWAMDGQHVPYVRVGGAIRYKLADLEAFVERQTIGTRS